MNINELNPIHPINLSEHTRDVIPGSGSFKDLYEKVCDNTIQPLIDHAGEIIGINYDAKCETILEDCIEQYKFTLRYQGKDIMGYIFAALQLKVENKEIASIDELEDAVVIYYANGDKKVIHGYAPCITDYDEDDDYEDDDDDDWENEDEEDERAELVFDDELYSDDSDLPVAVKLIFTVPNVDEKYVLKTLRNGYRHYLAKGKTPTVSFDYRDGETIVYVDEIEWGRRI